jgi:hypothetical protein
MCFIGVLEINTKTLKFRFKILQRIHGNEFWENQKNVRTKGIFMKTKQFKPHPIHADFRRVKRF